MPPTVRAEETLLCKMVVTFEPIPPLTDVPLVPEPVNVSVPALLTSPANVKVPLVAFEDKVRLPVPVTPPLKPEVPVPALLLPSVSIPVVPLPRTTGLAIVRPVLPINAVALSLPLVWPRVRFPPLPKALVLVEAIRVPARTVVPPWYVLAPESVHVPEPALTTVPATPVPITLARLLAVLEPSSVNSKPDPPIVPAAERMMLPLFAKMVLELPSVIRPEKVAAVEDEFVSAPAAEAPVPFKVRGSAVARLKPLRSSVAPELTTVAPATVPRGLTEAPTRKVPATTLVAPV